MRFILLETIADSRKYYPNMSDEDFNRVIALDPTFKREKDKLGNYGKWLLSLFSKGQLQNEGHVKDLLNRFESEKNNLINKDIMKYKSLDEVDKMLDDPASYKTRSTRQELKQLQKQVHKTDLAKDAELLFEDDDWQIWVPKTYEASCKLGRNTQWCTATTEKDYYYNYYTEQGNLYININKHNPNDKYQFHFESSQFMDAADNSIDLAEFFKDKPNLWNFYKPIFYKLLDIPDNGQDFITIMLDDTSIAEVLENRDLSADFILKLMRNDLYDEWLGYDYNYSLNDCYINESDLDQRNIDLLAKYGLHYDTNSNDRILPTNNENINNAFTYAIDSAVIVGSMDDAYNDFNIALENAMPKDLNWTYNGETNEYSFSVEKDKLVQHAMSVYQYSDFSDYEEVWLEYLAEYLVDHFKFYEPQYGWDGFSYIEFNDTLYNYLLELQENEQQTV